MTTVALPETADGNAACPYCGELIEPAFLELHLAGADGGRPECPHQDLSKILARVRGARPKFGTHSWA
jgi:hypothetical protein